MDQVAIATFLLDTPFADLNSAAISMIGLQQPSGFAAADIALRKHFPPTSARLLTLYHIH
jgi:hypothetical protein